MRSLLHRAPGIGGKTIAELGVVTVALTLFLPFVTLESQDWPYPGTETDLPGIAFVFISMFGFGVLGLLGVLPYVGIAVATVCTIRNQPFQAAASAVGAALVALTGTFSYITFHSDIFSREAHFAFGYYVWFIGAAAILAGSLMTMVKNSNMAAYYSGTTKPGYRRCYRIYMRVAREGAIVGAAGTGLAYIVSYQFGTHLIRDAV